MLLSDQGTLLRGVSLSWDGGDPYGSLSKVMPTQEQLHQLANVYGLNSVHLFLEGDSTGNTNPIGYNAEDCDILVQRCAEAGLYLIITIGCNGENGTMNLEWSLDFWEFYAPRYKDETHVIYEAHNEPVPHTLWQWTTEDWDDQVALYNTIRAGAPDTLILLCTFMGFVGDNDINSEFDPRNRANYLKANGVDWSNAGIAHHGYESKIGIDTAISLIQSSTEYPVLLCTEFWPGDTTGQEYNNMYESHFNGWMQFMWLSADDGVLTEINDGFRTKITKAGTVWTPDSPASIWPATGAPKLPADGASIAIYSRGARAFARIDSEGQLLADLTDFTGNQSDRFTIEHAGRNKIRLKAENGMYLSAVSEGSALRADSPTAGSNELFYWNELLSGEGVLRAVGSGHLLRATAEATVLPDGDNKLETASQFIVIDGSAPASPPPAYPYFGDPMVIPGLIEAEDFDTGGEGVAYHDAASDNRGGSYRTLQGVDIEPSGDGGLAIGWTEAGEWLQYTVDVLTSGEYTITARVARGSGGTATFHLEADGIDVTGPVTVGSTGGWQQWAEVNTSAVLEAGRQTIRLVFDREAVNFDALTFAAIGTPPPSPTLSMESVGSTLIFTWPASASGKGLLGVNSLDPPQVWSNLRFAPTQYGQEMRVVFEPSESAHFIQLADRINEPPAFKWEAMWWGAATVDQEYTGSIADVAADPDGDPISYTEHTGPAWLNISLNGELSGIPSSDDIGWHTFTLTCVADGGSDTATVHLEVRVPSE
jgi:hypothetical protein